MNKLLFMSAGMRAYWKRVRALYGASSIVQYIPMWDLSGVIGQDISGNGYNGQYKNNGGTPPALVGVTLGQTGIGDRRTSVLFNGSSGFLNVYSAGFSAAFNKEELTIILNVKIPAASWKDGTARRFFQIRADINNRIYIDKSATNDLLNFVYTAGGTSRGVNVTTTSEDFMQLAIVASKAGNFCRFLMNGVQQGTDYAPGAWIGDLASTLCIVGAGSTTPDNPTAGNFAHWIVLNRAASVAELLAGYNLNP